MLSLLLAFTLSGSPVLLKDIEPGAATDSETFLEVDTGADPNVLVVENDFWGTELFTIFDANTRSLIVDLCPGPCSSNPEQLTRIGGKLVFLATDLGEEFPNQLWVTDGTLEGTSKLADGVDNTRTLVARLIPLGDQVLFMKGGDVWVSDGTLAGTAAAPWGNRRQLVSASSTAAHRYLEVNELPIDRCQLLVTGPDVRSATALPMPGPAEHCSESIATLGERAFLTLSSGIWRFDGTGPPVPIDPTPGFRLTAVGPHLFFFRSDPATLTLLSSTGEAASTLTLSSLPTSTGVQHLGGSGTRLLYSAANQAGVSHLYGSDGTAAGTEQIATLLGPTFGIMSVGPEAFVADGIPAGSAELLETDGSPTGTSVLQGVFPFDFADRVGYRGGRGHPNALNLIALVVNELGAFRIRPGESPDVVFLKPANPRGSSPGPALLHGGEAFFTAGDDPGVYRTDGTPEGSTKLCDGGLIGFAGDRALVLADNQVRSVSLVTGEMLGLDAGSIFPQAARLIGTTALATGDNPRTLWTTDGTPGGTAKLAELGVVTAFPAPLELPDGRAVFATQRTLWFTDGTAPGTKSLEVPSAAALTVELVAAKGVWVLWAAADQSTALGYATADSVRQLQTWAPPQLPILFASEGDLLHFLVQTATEIELWSATPTSAEKVASTGLKSARALTSFKSRLLLLGNRGEGQSMFDVAADGQLTFLARAPGATFLHAEAGTLFADLATPASGLELNVFDERFGTFEPTADLSAGVGSSSPSPPLAVGTHFVFTAWTPEAGREPWSWTPDPTPVPHGCGCGTEGGASLLVALFLVARARIRCRA